MTRILVTIILLTFISTSAESRPRRAQNFEGTNYSQTTQIVAHPSGCPRRAFCGCGAALEVYGKHVRELWLAANWLRFPRAEPGPGMAAARRGHVMVIRQYLGNGKAVVYDANSGGRLTRVHTRSLAGYTVVNPHGGPMQNVAQRARSKPAKRRDAARTTPRVEMAALHSVF